ncbi:Lon family ATP-dependent protease [Pelosinus sp. IPA-1]|uniref:Lon family ATP-dependent protease n=1 Tax=Pelosinus sp. IPA-1 TaxID=3029569 RepID=UPI002436289A|nr:Lon family ATP-dependent protease [Pelosinus sp. IPA-1]GMB00107.1 ATP-dependent protease, Lon family protein [Pelosinus sp. IPA-1]
MKNFFNKLIPYRRGLSKATVDEQLKRQVSALYDMYSGVIGSDKVVLKAVKLDAISLMNSDKIGDRVLALQKLVFEDPTIEKVPTLQEIPQILGEVEEELADVMARRTLEDRLDKKINEKMEERHQEYVREIKMQVLKEEENNVENPQTLKKYASLEVLEQKKLTKSAMEMTRPSTLGEIVGQERAVEALSSKLASPYPQHLILYGPPGVGKTTAARLVLEAAKGLKFTPFAKDAPFVEVDGTTLRWDSRGMTNPLLGSVHDPIYQGARRDLAETGVPEPKPGLATDAHGGILFIDEIGEMDAMLQNKLLKVLEDKRVSFDSAYYDPSDPNVPKYIKKLFEDGAPADFILIGATTRDASDINPAIRSRCAEIYFEPLTPKHIEEIVYNAAIKLGVTLDPDVPALISEYTIEGRKAINILSDAFGLALYREGERDTVVITKEDVYKVVQVSRLTPFVSMKAGETGEVGKVFGLGVSGYLGSVIEIEAVSFAATEKGKGRMRFNDTAGSMAKDSVFNAAAVVRKITGEDLANYDIHINIIGGGRIDGPSAGTGILAAIISAITGRAIRQDVAVTGEISIQGKVKAVGGVFEKAYGAKQAGVTTMIIPKENEKDIPQGHLGLTICPVDDVEEALAILLIETEQKSA